MTTFDLFKSLSSLTITNQFRYYCCIVISSEKGSKVSLNTDSIL